MVRTVIVPLDGSALAEEALPIAQAVVKVHGARMLLVHVIDVPLELGSWSSASAPAFGAEVDNWIRESENYLREVAGRLDVPRVDVEVRFGRASAELREVVRREQDAVVVISSHGRTGARRLVLGSVAARMVHDAHCPVIVVRGTGRSSTAIPELRRVLVPLDGSEVGEAVLTVIPKVLGPQRQLHLVRVIELPAIPIIGVPEPGITLDYGLVGEYIDATRDVARDYLSNVASRLGGSDAGVTWEVREGEVVAEILAAARAQQSDIIAMSTHGRGGLSRLVLGSVAEGVLHETELPMLLIRPEI